MRLESRPISDSDTAWDVIEGSAEMTLGKIHKKPDGYYYHIEKETPAHHRAANFEDAEKNLFRLIEEEFGNDYP